MTFYHVHVAFSNKIATINIQIQLMHKGPYDPNKGKTTKWSFSYKYYFNCKQ